MREDELMRRVQIAATDEGARLFRNNVGSVKFVHKGKPRVVKYGLCPGSSDLIGWTPCVISPGMVGSTVAIFTAIECKGPRTPTRENQKAFVERVMADGGIAAIVREVIDAQNAIRRVD